MVTHLLKLEIKNTEKLTVITFSILYTEENEINAELFQLVHVAIYVLVFKYRFGLFLFITYYQNKSFFFVFFLSISIINSNIEYCMIINCG